MRIRLALALAFTAGMISTAAVAQSSEEQNLCMNDAFRVCSHTIPDRGRTVACMVENKSKLSSPCQMVMDKYATPTTATAYAAPAPAAPVRTTKNASMKPIKTATNTPRAGKPLNILMR
ncbi:MAG: hypothetical protein QOF14_4544 [Hyphomicrobiales bacterium]|jgi:hypothetical protein|nr:hypothetical protein [Hyphomicrobiales bacterium]